MIRSKFVISNQNCTKMDMWNWNFSLEYRSVYDNAWFWPYDSNQPINDIYEQNVAKLKIVSQSLTLVTWHVFYKVTTLNL